MWRRPRSWECGDFPYREKAELMPPRSWGYSPSLESEDCVVGSLCMVRKMFPYKNMHVDYVRPRGTRWYASSSTGVICQPSRERCIRQLCKDLSACGCWPLTGIGYEALNEFF